LTLDEGLISNSFVRTDRIYLNNASSSLIPLQTIKAMTDFTIQYNELGPDSHEFVCLLAEKTANLRQLTSKLIGCRPEEVIFTQSTTEGINIVAGGMTFPKKSNIIIRGTTHEHHSNYFPWLRLAKKTKVQSLKIDEDGFFDVSELEQLINKNTRLVALSHALYNTGAIMPANEVGKILKENGIPYFLDAAQTVGCIGEFDFSQTGADFMAFNGYKWLCGPMGIGIFVCKKESVSLLEPLQVAGESSMVYDSVNLVHKDIPDRFQASFRNFAAIAGLESSITFLSNLGLANIRHKIIGLANLLRDDLSRISGVTLYGPDDEKKRTSIVSFAVEKSPQQVVELLEKQKIVVAMREISDKKIVRASPHFFNTETEILRLVEAIKNL
jgi:cysteine desulfurase/selenocysteine lyase